MGNGILNRKRLENKYLGKKKVGNRILDRKKVGKWDSEQKENRKMGYFTETKLENGILERNWKMR